MKTKTLRAFPDGIRDIHNQLKNGKPLTEEQVDKLCYIFNNTGKFGLSCHSHLAMDF